MNPLFQALMGGMGAPGGFGGQSAMQMPGTPSVGFQGVLQRAQQIAGAMRNPQELVRQYFPDAPETVSGDPEQLVGWLQQTGRVSPQMVNMARQMMGRR